MRPTSLQSERPSLPASSRRELRTQRKRARHRRRWALGAGVVAAVVTGAAFIVPAALTASETAVAEAAAAEAAAAEASTAARQQLAIQTAVARIEQQKADQGAVAALVQAESVISSAEGVADTGALRSSVAALGEYRTLHPDVVTTLTAITAATAQETAAAEAAARDLAAVNTPEGSRKVARELAASTYGWGEAQFSCLNSLWQKESGWRYQALNASSGATGIPQSLPGSKMASAGPDWATNARTQIVWGLEYIKRGYGTPCAAWSHSQSVNWY